jgi:hypothetical protein
VIRDCNLLKRSFKIHDKFTEQKRSVGHGYAEQRRITVRRQQEGTASIPEGY